MQVKKYEYIDSLRGIAVLMVLVVHVANFFKTPTTEYFPNFLFAFLYNGRIGVQLFFMISAFTLMSSFERRMGEKNGTSNFYIRRFFRIAPMYYLAIILITIYWLNFDSRNFGVLVSPWYISNFLFLNSLVPYWVKTIVPGGWSVSVEFTFYILFPFIASRIRSINSAAIALFGSIIFALLFMYNVHDKYIFYQLDFHQTCFYYQIPVFFIGIFTYWLTKENISQIHNKSWAILIISLFLLTYMRIPYYLFYTLIFSILILVLQKKPYKLLCNKFFSKIGTVSFSMYIVHFMVIMTLDYFKLSQLIPITDLSTSLLNYILLFIIVSSISYTISYFSYKLIEIPGQNLGKKIIKFRSTK